MNDDELAAISAFDPAALARVRAQHPRGSIGHMSPQVVLCIESLQAERDEARAALTEARVENQRLREENAAHIERTIFQRGELSRLASALAEARAELVAHERRALSVDDHWLALVRARESELAEAHRTLADVQALLAKADDDSSYWGQEWGGIDKEKLRAIVAASRSGAESAGEQR